MTMQEDCNLVLRELTAKIQNEKHSDLQHEAIAGFRVPQLVPTYNQPGSKDHGIRAEIWSSQTNGKGSGCSLVLPTEGDASQQTLMVIDSDGAVVWHAGAQHSGLTSVALDACNTENDPMFVGYHEDGSEDNDVLEGKHGQAPVTGDYKYRWIGLDAKCEQPMYEEYVKVVASDSF